MRKRQKLLVVLILSAVVLVVALLSSLYKKNRAVDIAQEYLEQKYGQKMQYLFVYHQAWFYPQYYRVRFASVDIPEVTFSVCVQENMSIPDEFRDFENGSLSADNYQIGVFEYYMEQQLAEDTKQIWGNSASIVVLDSYNMDGAFFTISPKLHLGMSLAEMEPLINNYWIYVETQQTLREEKLDQIAGQIIEFQQFIKESGFRPETIYFCFPEANKSERCISFEDWEETFSINQIITRLKGA